MLKVITTADRCEMLAERIESPVPFDMTVPDICAYGHCRQLFGESHPQSCCERNTDYVARMLGIAPETAMRLYYGYAPDTPVPLAPNGGLDRFGPLTTRASVAAALRQLAAGQRA